MLPTIFAMLIIRLVAAAVLGMVVVGMEGTGQHRMTDVAQHLARAGRHLNGEADPPKGLVAFFEQAEEGADDLRHLSGQLVKRRSASSASSGASAGSAASARSARTAVSAPTSGSAPTARSAATPPRPRLFPPRPAASSVPAPSPVPAAPPGPPVPRVESAWGRPEVRSEWAQPLPSTSRPDAGPPPAAGPRDAWAVWSSEGPDA